MFAACIAPVTRLRTGCAQDGCADLNDRSIFLSLRDEPGGQQQTRMWMLPTDQRLSADDPSRLNVDLRLIVDDELSALNCRRHFRGLSGWATTQVRAFNPPPMFKRATNYRADLTQVEGLGDVIERAGP